MVATSVATVFLNSWRSRFRSPPENKSAPRFAAAAAAADPARVVESLRANGFLRLDGVLSATTCKAVLTHAAGELAAALAAVRSGRVPAAEKFAEHLLIGEQAGKRHDVKLSLTAPVVCSAIREALHSLRGVYAASLGSGAGLFELSCITSDPGTPEQALHADFADWPPASEADADGEDVGPMALVLFVALEHVSLRMGPTRFVPGSHTRAYHWQREHAAFEEGGEARRSVAPLLRRGDAVLMDAACLHGGGANTLKPRAIFHLSFCRDGFAPSGFASYAQSLSAESEAPATGAAGCEEHGEDEAALRRRMQPQKRHRLDQTDSWLGGAVSVSAVSVS